MRKHNKRFEELQDKHLNRISAAMRPQLSAVPEPCVHGIQVRVYAELHKHCHPSRSCVLQWVDVTAADFKQCWQAATQLRPTFMAFPSRLPISTRETMGFGFPSPWHQEAQLMFGTDGERLMPSPTLAAFQCPLHLGGSDWPTRRCGCNRR